MTYRIRYTPGSELARRFPQAEPRDPVLTFPTPEAAEEIRRRCPNVNDMEVYEVMDA